ncbi:phosphoribosylanthranilate isomerase [Paraburkholderia sp. J8-2]|uniref:phosphoribosylanthranilate isomerase n=1 Tax=Paraburkholderia sp. J8-2 TaxID=2805440 RepID=UPI002AB68D0A|nr:phosphoribosylanthranilate isomerase [Paraburkholderia sp. J8-2]
MDSFIKVCGIQSVDEALGATRAGANTIGLLMGITHVAEDKITPATGREIVRALPRSIRTVMVTHLLDVDEIAAVASSTGVSAIQIHDELPVEGIAALRTRMPAIKLIKAVHVQGEDAIAHARTLSGFADMLILDSRTKDRLGGTGLTHDWNLSRQIVASVDVPVILAGGLTPDNVESAIRHVNPAGIDANSGLEHPDGSKDFQKIERFAAAGRTHLKNFE